MIKNIFEVSDDEKRRILGLHESATKKQYLITEDDREIFKLCGYEIVINSGRYYAQDGSGNLIELPFESELGLFTTNKGKEFDGYNDITENGLLVGKEMFKSCGSQKWPDDYKDGGSMGVPVCYVLDKGEYKGYPVWNFMHTYVGKEYPNSGRGDMNSLLLSKTEAVYGKTYTKNYKITLAMGLRAYGEPYKETPQPVIEELNLSVDDPFEFDKTTLNPEGQKRFDEFLQKLKKYYQYLQKGTITINTYASIDGDPNKGPVGGFKTRKEYDMDLSNRRAQAIMKLIEDEMALGLFAQGIRLTAQGNGETNQFDKSPTGSWPGSKGDTTKTAKNRKLIITCPPIRKPKQK